MTNAYRDELESLRARAEALEHEAKVRDAELGALRARLAERDALFDKLRTVVGAKPRRRLWPLAVAGVAALTAVGTLVLLRGRAAAPFAPVSAVAPVAAAMSASASEAAEPSPPPEVASCGESYIAIVRESGAVECLHGPSGNAVRTGIEILQQGDGTPYLIIDGADAYTTLDIVGPVHFLPGAVDGLRVRIRDAAGFERLSTSSRVRVTTFGAVGERVKGDAFATMVPRLNEPPEQLRVVFSVVRGPDRHGP